MTKREYLPLDLKDPEPENACNCECPKGPCEHVWDGPKRLTGARNVPMKTCSVCKMNLATHSFYFDF